MATVEQITEQTYQDEPEAKDIRLRCAVAGARYVLTPAETVRVDGRVITVARDEIVKFENGLALVSARQLERLQRHPDWGKQLFLADDPNAPTPQGVSVQVGQISAAGIPAAAESAPDFVAPDGWESEHNSVLDERIKGGEFDSILGPLVAYEIEHANRSQIMAALSKRRRDETKTEE